MSGTSNPSPTSVPAPAPRQVQLNSGGATDEPIQREHPFASHARRYLGKRAGAGDAPARFEFFAPAYHAALGLVFRQAMDCFFEKKKITNKQEAAAERASEFLPEIERRLREARSGAKPSEVLADPAPTFTQSYIAAIYKSFAPSVSRLSALAKAAELPPSCAALMTETLLNQLDGQYPTNETDAGEEFKSLYEFFQSDVVGAESKRLYNYFRALLNRCAKEPIKSRERDGRAQKTFVHWLSAGEGALPVHGTFPEGLAGAIREWRENKLGWSQPELARQLNDGAGKNAGTAISQVENFRHSPSWPRMFSFARLCRQPVSDLFYEAEWQSFSLAHPLEFVLDQVRALRDSLDPEAQKKFDAFLRERGGSK
jgi:transcriptional regulator with XRE-family HTH domain